MSETRKIGSLEVSLVGLGCNNFGGRLDADATAKVVYAALDAGINFFDTADIYGGTKSEEFIGNALGARRDEVVLATKFGIPLNDEMQGGAKPEYIRRAAEDSLRRLRTDRIDLYQLHRPDPDVPIEETLGALNELVLAGKVREIGCSNFSAEQIRAAEAAVQTGAARFVSVQNHYSLFHREPEESVLPECDKADIAFLPFFPLANGLLTGKYRKGKPFPEGTRIQPEGRFANLLTEENFDKVEALLAYAEAHGHTLLELAFSWLAAQPTVASVIAGATSPQQIQSNVGAAGWKLTSEEIAQINGIVSP